MSQGAIASMFVSSHLHWGRVNVHSKHEWFRASVPPLPTLVAPPRSACVFPSVQVADVDAVTHRVQLSDSDHWVYGYLGAASVAALEAEFGSIKNLEGGLVKLYGVTLHTCPHEEDGEAAAGNGKTAVAAPIRPPHLPPILPPSRAYPDICLHVDRLEYYAGAGNAPFGAPVCVGDHASVRELVRTLPAPVLCTRAPESAAAAARRPLLRHTAQAYTWKDVAIRADQAAVLQRLTSASAGGFSSTVPSQATRSFGTTGTTNSSRSTIQSGEDHGQSGTGRGVLGDQVESRSPLAHARGCRGGQTAAAAEEDEEEEEASSGVPDRSPGGSRATRVRWGGHVVVEDKPQSLSPPSSASPNLTRSGDGAAPVVAGEQDAEYESDGFEAAAALGNAGARRFAGSAGTRLQNSPAGSQPLFSTGAAVGDVSQLPYPQLTLGEATELDSSDESSPTAGDTSNRQPVSARQLGERHASFAAGNSDRGAEPATTSASEAPLGGHVRLGLVTSPSSAGNADHGQEGADAVALQDDTAAAAAADMPAAVAANREMSSNIAVVDANVLRFSAETPGPLNVGPRMSPIAGLSQHSVFSAGGTGGGTGIRGSAHRGGGRNRYPVSATCSPEHIGADASSRAAGDSRRQAGLLSDNEQIATNACDATENDSGEDDDLGAFAQTQAVDVRLSRGGWHDTSPTASASAAPAVPVAITQGGLAIAVASLPEAIDEAASTEAPAEDNVLSSQLRSLLSAGGASGYEPSTSSIAAPTTGSTSSASRLALSGSTRTPATATPCASTGVLQHNSSANSSNNSRAHASGGDDATVVVAPLASDSAGSREGGRHADESARASNTSESGANDARDTRGAHAMSTNSERRLTGKQTIVSISSDEVSRADAPARSQASESGDVPPPTAATGPAAVHDDDAAPEEAAHNFAPLGTDASSAAGVVSSPGRTSPDADADRTRQQPEERHQRDSALHAGRNSTPVTAQHVFDVDENVPTGPAQASEFALLQDAVFSPLANLDPGGTELSRTRGGPAVGAPLVLPSASPRSTALDDSIVLPYGGGRDWGGSVSQVTWQHAFGNAGNAGSAAAMENTSRGAPTSQRASEHEAAQEHARSKIGKRRGVFAHVNDKDDADVPGDDRLAGSDAVALVAEPDDDMVFAPSGRAVKRRRLQRIEPFSSPPRACRDDALGSAAQLSTGVGAAAETEGGRDARVASRGPADVSPSARPSQTERESVQRSLAAGEAELAPPPSPTRNQAAADVPPPAATKLLPIEAFRASGPFVLLGLHALNVYASGGDLSHSLLQLLVNPDDSSERE